MHLENGAANSVEPIFSEDVRAFRYSVHDADGRKLASSGLLPSPRPVDFNQTQPQLRDTQFKGEKLRLVTLPVIRPNGTAMLVQAAEPVQARLILGRSILGNIVIPQLIFIVIAGVAVWIGLKRGFEPLERLRRAVAARPRNDLRPLDETRAPGEVRPLIQEVNALIARLQAMMDSHRRFIADAAHQLRTPFAGLKAQVERICVSAQRCSHLVTQLLTLARNEPEARRSAMMETLDLNRISQAIAAHWAPDALQKNIDIGFEAAEHPCPVKGDEASLRDLIDNLIDNAIRYTPSGGKITVRVGYGSIDHSSTWLEVEDNGPGIPLDQRERVFERFHRIPGNNQPGSGLGLAIVQEVVMRHGAQVEIDDGQDGGSLFRIRFPHQGESGDHA
jgi:two-component system sensor histidine kinase TctE